MSEPETDADGSPSAVVQEFIGHINGHNAAGLSRLMTDDHLFVDSLGNSVRGREEMRGAWIAYFYMIPDFTITIQERFERENVVALFGSARGTYSTGGDLLEHNRWEMPAAWRAVVRNGLVAEWRVYADNEPVRRIMAGETPDQEDRH